MTSAPAEDPAVLAQFDAYVNLASQLAEADASGRDAIYLKASQDYAREPSETNKLYLALVLGTAGHTYTDMARADQLLIELEAMNEQRPPVMASLVRMRRAMFSLTRAAHVQLRSLTRENRDLQKKLQDAEAKIKALTAIEQKLEAPAADSDAGRVRRLQ